MIAFAMLLFSTPLLSNNLSSCTVCVDQSTSDGISISLNVKGLSIFPIPEKNEYQITISGESSGGSIGNPDLPHISRLIKIPDGMKAELSWSGNLREKNFELNDASPTIVSAFSDDNQNQWNKETAFSNRRSLWPPEVVQISDPMIMRGVRLVNLTVNPVQYNYDTGELNIYDQLNVELKFVSDNNNRARRTSGNTYSSSVAKIIESMVINPQDLPAFDEIIRGSYVYIITDDEGVDEAIAPLVELRLRQGYPTELMTIDDRTTNVDIRNMIEDAYYEWDFPPEIISIVGDASLEGSDILIPTWDVGRAYMWETDYKYVLLEGDDLLPEAAVGRISFRNFEELESMVSKIITYETNPHMEDGDGNEDVAWFRQAAVMANDPRTGYSSIYLQQWLRKVLLEVGYTSVDTIYFLDNPSQDACHNFLLDNFENGMSLFNYRGWGQFNGAWSLNDANDLSNDNMLPLMILPTCNTADFADQILGAHSYAEEFFWPDEEGAIGVIGSSGFTHTNYNNVLDGGILNGLLRDKNWRFGWALNQGKLELFRHFGMFNDVEDPQVRTLLVWEAHAYQFNLIGDPGTELWTDYPQHINVDYNEAITPGQNMITVTVTDVEDDSPQADVRITLVRDNEILRNEMTNSEGQVILTFSAGELNTGTYLLSATKHNVIPHLGEFEVEEVDQFVGFSSVFIDDDQAGRSNGNGNNVANTGERLELITYLRNFGNDNVDEELEISINITNGDLEIIEGEVTINQGPGNNDSTAVTFIADVGQSNCNGREIVLNMDVQRGGDIWESAILFNISAPDLKYLSHSFDPDPFTPGDTAFVEITIWNGGNTPSTEMQGTLLSNREVIVVYDELADFGPLDPVDDEVTARFQVYAHTLTVPGTSINMTLILENDDGFSDTTEFSFVVGNAEANTPFGPDAYGYVCFDNTDEEWSDNIPEYDWIEIDSTLDGPGHSTGIADLGNEQDFSVFIDLPFEFQYYGQVYGDPEGPNERRGVTICSNGWFAFGDESRLADFQNRRIPPALGPRAQVCVFWDDLVNYTDQDGEQIGGIYYWYDEENNRFIIEWSRMRRYVGMVENNMREGAVNTFQAILYDPQHRPTYTGDGEIVFQYQTVNDEAQVDPLEFDTPFATVGIVNLNGTDGMEYVFWNEYTPGAAILEDERTIKFSTVLLVVVGFVDGVVTESGNETPIANAEIRGNRGSFGLTRDDGRFLMNNVLIGDDYSFTAWAPGYNEITLEPYDVTEGDTIHLDFELTHPTFNISADSIVVDVQPEYGTSKTLEINNEGDGPLIFKSYFDYAGEDQNERWERLLDVNLEEQIQVQYIFGVDFFNGSFWITGKNRGFSPRIYLFDRDGNFDIKFYQPVDSYYGLRGLTSNDSTIYGSDGEWILGINREGEIVDSIPGPFDTNPAIAFDPAGFFYVANGRFDPLVKIDLDGNLIESWEHELDIQGIGFLRDDPDGYTVYIVSRDRTNPARHLPFALVKKLNPVTGDFMNVAVLEGDSFDDSEDKVGGIEITNGYDPQKWVMAAIMTNGNGDRLSVYDLGPNTDWISYSPRNGIIEPGSSEELNFNMSAAGLEEGSYQLILNYVHNAAGLNTTIPITMIVDLESAFSDKKAIPLEFNLGQNYPNPFNAQTIIPFSLAENGWVELSIYDINGREITRLIDKNLKAGRHSAEFDAKKYSSGVYIIKLKAGQNTANLKTALIK